MRRAFLIAIELVGVACRDGDVDAGLDMLDQLIDRDRRRDLNVADIFDVERALEELGRAIGDIVETVVGDRLTEPVVDEMVDHGAIGETVERDMRLGDIDALDRQADALGEWQQGLTLVEEDVALAIGDLHRYVYVLGQGGAVGAGQAGLHPHIVVLAVLQAADTEILAAHLQRVIDLGRDRDIRLEPLRLAR